MPGLRVQRWLFAVKQAAHFGAKLRCDVVALQPISHVCCEKSDFRAAVEAAAFEFQSIKRLDACQRHHRVGELNFTASARRLLDGK